MHEPFPEVTIVDLTEPRNEKTEHGCYARIFIQNKYTPSVFG